MNNEDSQPHRIWKIFSTLFFKFNIKLARRNESEGMKGRVETNNAEYTQDNRNAL